jgi:hypothetical protein
MFSFQSLLRNPLFSPAGYLLQSIKIFKMKRILRLLFISFIFLSTKSFATGSLTISTVALAALRIFDMNGKIIWQSANVINSGVITIPFDAFGKGVYTVEVSMQKNIERILFIKAGR